MKDDVDYIVTIFMDSDIKVKMEKPVSKPILTVKKSHFRLAAKEDIERYFNYKDSEGKKKVLVKYFLSGQELPVSQVITLDELMLRLIF